MNRNKEKDKEDKEKDREDTQHKEGEGGRETVRGTKRHRREERIRGT